MSTSGESVDRAEKMPMAAGDQTNAQKTTKRTGEGCLVPDANAQVHVAAAIVSQKINRRLNCTVGFF
jgi:hypothetical protein